MGKIDVVPYEFIYEGHWKTRYVLKINNEIYSCLPFETKSAAEQYAECEQNRLRESLHTL